MKALFLGIREEKWTNKKSGETGLAFYLSVSTDTHPSAEIRLEKNVYKDFEGLTRLTPISLEFELLKGDDGCCAVVVEGYSKQTSTKPNGAGA